MSTLHIVSKNVFQKKERLDTTKESFLRQFFVNKQDLVLFDNLKLQGKEIIEILFNLEKKCPKICEEKGMKMFLQALVYHYKIGNGLFYVNTYPQNLSLTDAVEYINSEQTKGTATTFLGMLYSLYEITQLGLILFDKAYDNLEISEIIEKAKMSLDVKTIQAFIFFISFVKHYEEVSK